MTAEGGTAQTGDLHQLDYIKPDEKVGKGLLLTMSDLLLCSASST